MNAHRKILPALACWALALAGPPSPGAELQIEGGPQLQDLLQKGEAADARLQPDTALPFYLRAEHVCPGNAQLLLRIARDYSDSTLTMADPAESQRRLQRALDYSCRAAEIEPRNPVALLSKAICYGKLAQYCDTRSKIEYSRLVKQFADQALALDPNCAYAHHVLGQWECEIASLGRAKQFLVALIYGSLPTASTEEGVRHLERAVELEPDVATHRLALGFAYLANGESGKARHAFEQVIAMPCREFYDADCHRQAARAIARL